ncbi:rod shape-determining protein MreC [Candidatus Pelagibacter bacterium nBUS_28]|uniref:rod shape-determining protein MreC n=1 Tax=Candidatus Pelagibacter bacterium nBUS_28 TaxID=3374189 RepID=UPI003EBF169A
MATGRDDFVIAFRSAFLKKKDKQKFSLLTLLFLSIFVIILSNFDFKIIRFIKFGINEVVYKSSYLISIPENKIQNIKKQLTAHLEIYNDYQDIKSELNLLKEEKLTNNFLKLENEKLRNLINENVSSKEILAKVLIDKESPFLKSIVLNKGSKNNVKIGMAIMDGVYLAGKVIEVNYTNSRALLLSDLNSKIPVTLLPDRIQAVVSGTGKNHGVIEYTKEKVDDEINEKDRIIYTSGFAGLFRSGIPVGRMFKKSNGKIDFFSKFTQLEYVKIVAFDMESQK